MTRSEGRAAAGAQELTPECGQRGGLLCLWCGGRAAPAWSFEGLKEELSCTLGSAPGSPGPSRRRSVKRGPSAEGPGLEGSGGTRSTAGPGDRRVGGVTGHRGAPHRSAEQRPRLPSAGHFLRARGCAARAVHVRSLSVFESLPTVPRGSNNHAPSTAKGTGSGLPHDFPKDAQLYAADPGSGPRSSYFETPCSQRPPHACCLTFYCSLICRLQACG